MAINLESYAEVLYDQISGSYEDAYSGNPGIVQAIEKLKEYHAPGSSALDVGCGPGGPASRLIEAGYNVTGIDVAQNMIDICQASLSGTFVKTDMMKFEPETQFDVIAFFLSLFQVTHAVTQSMLFKAASWLRPGGTLVVATIAAEDYIQDASQLLRLQHSQYLENFDTDFMGRVVPATLLTVGEWLRIIQEAGLLIQAVDRHEFQVAGFDAERQLFIVAKKA